MNPYQTVSSTPTSLSHPKYFYAPPSRDPHDLRFTYWRGLALYHYKRTSNYVLRLITIPPSRCTSIDSLQITPNILTIHDHIQNLNFNDYFKLKTSFCRNPSSTPSLNTNTKQHMKENNSELSGKNQAKEIEEI